MSVKLTNRGFVMKENTGLEQKRQTCCLLTLGRTWEEWRLLVLSDFLTWLCDALFSFLFSLFSLSLPLALISSLRCADLCGTVLGSCLRVHSPVPLPGSLVLRWTPWGTDCHVPMGVCCGTQVWCPSWASGLFVPQLVHLLWAPLFGCSWSIGV